MSQRKKPLSYAEKKAVLEQADPNKRIRWGLECPELGKIEKRVPLKCKEIRLDDNSAITGIDEVSYRVSITIQHETHKKATCDIDEQGRRVWATKNVLGPGDIMLSKGPDRDVTDRPLLWFSPYIEFRIDEEPMERLEYKGKTLIEAQRHLNTCLFGNRNHPIEVERLVVGRGVLRLPEGVKFHVRKLDLELISLEYLDNLQTILAPECLPLEHVYIRYAKTNAKECDHPMVKSARTLSLFDTISDDFLEFLKSIRNPTIFHECAFPDVVEHIELIQDWMNHPREVGSSITFERLYERNVEDIFDTVMQTFKYRENEEEDVFISINEDLELHFTAGDDQGTSARELIESGFQEDFSFFRMEVVPAGSL